MIRHTTPDHQIFLELNYEYDDSGRLKQATEETTSHKLNISYSYDGYGQLLRADYSDGRHYEYTYDSFGNRLKVADCSGKTTATYSKNDFLTSLNGQPVKHDVAGNVTKIGEEKFTYNTTDALTDDGHHRYEYNALGLRVDESGSDGTSRFLHFIDELPYVLAATGQTTTRYIWGDRQVLGQIGNDNKPLFFFEDQLGSIRAAMDSAGNIVDYAEYSPFGEPIKQIAGVRFGFVGEEQDETGKVYLRNRYYLPKIGRFLSKDPVLPQLMDEIKQNRYAYAANSPLSYTDHNGTYSDETNRWELPLLTKFEQDASALTIIPKVGTGVGLFVSAPLTTYGNFISVFGNTRTEIAQNLTVDNINKYYRLELLNWGLTTASV